MAGLKKQKKEKSTSPNVVLVIFLVFFFLLSIGLGIWGYYGYAGQEDLRRARSNADAAARASKLGLEYYSMLYGDLRVALGDTIDPAEEDQFNTAREAFLSEGFGKFKDEKTKEAAKKLMGTVSTLAETASEFCSNRCLHVCATHELARGLYRGRCMERCVPHCLYNNPRAKIA